MVTDTSKVSSTAATTFTDDKDASKTVKVDAVLESTAEPTSQQQYRAMLMGLIR